MNDVVHTVLLSVIAAWSINASAGDKTHTEDKVAQSVSEHAHLQSNQLGPIEVENIQAKDFVTIWFAVGQDLGYPKLSLPDNAHPQAWLEFLDNSWVSADFAQWNEYNNKKRFYLAGIITKYNVEKSRVRTPEDFKSFTIGYFQCVNAVTTGLQLARKSGAHISGTVEDIFKMCSLGRIVGSDAE
jgi:hypothetical protein